MVSFSPIHRDEYVEYGLERSLHSFDFVNTTIYCVSQALRKSQPINRRVSQITNSVVKWKDVGYRDSGWRQWIGVRESRKSQNSASIFVSVFV